MARNRKKIVRLTENEMVTLIERIVTEVKKEKRNSIQENRVPKRSRRGPVTRRR